MQESNDTVFGAFLIPGSFLFVGTHDPEKWIPVFRNQKKSSPGLGHLSIQAWRLRCLN
jgi:hypothetical protein